MHCKIILSNKYAKRDIKILLSLPCKFDKNTMQTQELHVADTPVVMKNRVAHDTHCCVWFHFASTWVCTTCGCYSAAKVRGLTNPCTRTLSKTGRENLARLEKGLLPGFSKAAREFNQDRVRYRKRNPDRPELFK